MSTDRKDEYAESERIEELKGKLYRKSFRDRKQTLLPHLSARNAEVPSVWNIDDEQEKHVRAPEDEMLRTGKGQKIFFGVSVGFFFVALAIAAFVFLGGMNFISSRNITIVMDAPTSVAGGDEVSVYVTIRNGNNHAITDANIVVTYPEGFVVTDEEGNIQKSEFRSLGMIKAGQTNEQILKGVVFGGEGDSKTITVTMEYRVENSNAMYTKVETYDVRIDTAPIGVSMTSLAEVNSGQETEFTVTVSSNADVVLKDIALRMEFPFGFTAREASPRPVEGTTLWRLGDIPAGESRTITIRGVIVGQNNDEKIVRAYVGLEHSDMFGELKNIYNESEVAVVVKDMFLGVQLVLNGSIDDTYAFTPGTQVRGTLKYANNLDVPLRDVRVQLSFDGSAISKYGIQASSGYYNSGNGTILWDASTYDEFAMLEPGESGSLDFSFTTVRTIDTDVTIQNPLSIISVDVKGTREDTVGSLEEHRGAIIRSVSVLSDIRLAARAVYSVGPFTNVGGLPPVPEQETTYTIMLSVANSSNNVSDVVVTGVLPHGVSWKTSINPSSADVTYNEFSRTVTWPIGRMSSGSGIGSTGPAVAFQVGLVPNVTQSGKVLPLFSGITLSAYDEFARERIIRSIDTVTTNIVSDPLYTQEKGAVSR